MRYEADFDTKVRPVLHRVLAEANVVESHANHVERAVRDLPARPQWITKAEDALQQAETSLVRAIQNVRAAREFYRNVKIEEV